MVTPCGHVYCWACLLRHASYTSVAGSAPPCPLCGVAVRPAAVRPVRLVTPQPHTPGATLTLTLVRRAPGCTAAYPAHAGAAPARLPDRARDGAAACVFARYSVSGDRAGVARRQLAELAAQERECVSEGDAETLVFVRTAMASVQDTLSGCSTSDDEDARTTAEKEEGKNKEVEWDVPVPPGDDAGARELFYQAADGEAVFLERVDMRMLLAAARTAHGGRLPRTVAARVLQCTAGVLGAAARRRVRATAVLPLGASFAVVELDLRGVVDAATYAAFAPALRARAAQRDREAALRREEARRADVPLCRTALFASPSGFGLAALPRYAANVRPTEFSEASFPSLSSSSPSPAPAPEGPREVKKEEEKEEEEPRLSYAEVARAAAAASRPLSIAAEADFPSLSSAPAPAPAPAPAAAAPRHAAFVPVTKPKRQPKPKAANKPQKQQETRPAAAAAAVQDAVAEEPEDGGCMVVLASKKQQGSTSKGRGRHRRPQ